MTADAPYRRWRGALRPGDHRLRLGQLAGHARARRLAHRDHRGVDVRRHLPERRLHPDQDVRLPGRSGPSARATRPRLGVDAHVDGVRWTDIRDRVFERIDAISDGGRDYRARRHANVTLYETHASFTGAHTLALGTGETITADRSSSPPGHGRSIPELIAESGVPYHTSDTVMRIDEVPDAGSHPGRRLHRRGIRPRLLLLRRADDGDRAQRPVAAPSRRRGVRRVHRSRRGSGTCAPAARSPGAARDGRRGHDASSTTVQWSMADLLLVATGRTPNSDRLDAGQGRRRGAPGRSDRRRRASAHVRPAHLGAG